MNNFIDSDTHGTTHTHANGVVELDPADSRATVCGACGRGWDDSVSTAWTPAPAGRCPFEYDHAEEQDDPWAHKSAYDLWNALVLATSDSDADWDLLQEWAVTAGFLKACPDCSHTVSQNEPVGPCEACEGDE